MVSDAKGVGHAFRRGAGGGGQGVGGAGVRVGSDRRLVFLMSQVIGGGEIEIFE